MGNGAEVAKEAADIILTDSNISAIEKTVRYGRTVFRSIRKFIVFQLIMNLSAVGISVLGPLFGFENPVTVTQMLWVNMIMDTLAAIAFAGEAPLERYMKSPPIPKNEPVLNGDMITRIFVMGVYTVTLCLYYLFSPQIASLFGGRESAEFLSGFFALFVFCGVFGAFTARSGRVNIISGLFANPVFVTVIAAVFCTQVGMIYLGGAALRCAPLSATQMCRVILIALTVIPAGMALELALKIRMPAVRRTEKSGGT
jgi:magnesium-transporting ATPase (P-type)